MPDTLSRHCVLLPCSARRTWVVPQTCLGEIVTVAAADDRPPAEISWRGQRVPVVDFSGEDGLSWRDQRGGSGLVAIVLGQRGEACEYFGVAVRGEGLGVKALAGEQMEDLPEAVLDYAVAAFRMQDAVYQVPDLLAVQRALAAGGGALCNEAAQGADRTE